MPKQATVVRKQRRTLALITQKETGCDGLTEAMHPIFDGKELFDSFKR